MELLIRIRPVNIFILAGVQYLLRWTVIIPFLKNAGMESSVHEPFFFLIVLSVILIAAGGYLINDLKDVQIDQVNKPGAIISRKQIITGYWILTGAGILTAIFLSVKLQLNIFWQINLLSAILLFFYPDVLKKIPVVGNLIICTLTVLVFFLILMTDRNAFIYEEIRLVVFAYSFFAFMMTWVRELIKDMEDIEGDRQFGRKTIPAVSGILFSKFLVVFLVLITLSAIILIQIMRSQWNDPYPFMYVVLFIELPLLLLISGIWKFNSKKRYHQLSSLAKAIMGTGILSMLVFHLLN